MLVAYMYHVTRINQIRPPLLALLWGKAWTSSTSRDVHGQSHAKAVTGSRRILLYLQCRLLLSAFQNFILAESVDEEREREMSHRQETVPRNRLYYVSTCLFAENTLHTLHRICCIFAPKYAKICASIYKNAPASGGLRPPDPLSLAPLTLET